MTEQGPVYNIRIPWENASEKVTTDMTLLLTAMRQSLLCQVAAIEEIMNITPKTSDLRKLQKSKLDKQKKLC